MSSKLLTLLVFAVSTASSFAIPVMDQNPDNADTLLIPFRANAGLGQSFRQSGANISGAGLFINNGGVGISTGLPGATTLTLTINLWDTLPNQRDAQLLATGAALATVSGVNGHYVDVFWAPVATLPNKGLFLEFSLGESGLGVGLWGSSDDNYLPGDAYANGFGLFSGYDYAFRTYSDNGVSEVHEPATLALVGLGILGISSARRKAILPTYGSGIPNC